MVMEKTIAINQNYRWQVEYENGGYIYISLQKYHKHWFWSDWRNTGLVLCYSIIKDHAKTLEAGFGSTGCALTGIFFGRVRTITIQNFDLETFNLTNQLDKEWISYAERIELANAKNKMIENIINNS